ncbi:MAG: DUF2934 domain-containing protein [Betaproteobacteria bacterium]|nr:DUF2934 domain-containing protein [Betaproteobacteria bacterium]MBV9362349.1 DUF2934 domain-containing protein [Betaproteobacteria bacterium]
MAKGKPTSSTGKKPLQAQRPSKAAPDTASLRPADGKASGNTGVKLSPEEVYRLIQESAYFKAKERGFAPGHEVQDWIEAEAEVRRRLDSRA